jgi:hypothetical protein
MENGTYVLKSIGTGRLPVDEYWLPGRIDEDGGLLGFPKHRRPNLGEDTHVLLYAAGHMKLVAAGVITTEPEFAPEKGDWMENKGVGWGHDVDRWPWVVAWEPRLLVPYVSLAPHVDDVGINRLSVRSQSYLNITDKQFDRAVKLMAYAAHS